MQFNFNKLELGAQISLIAIGIAFISLFMPWMDSWGRNHNAFFEGAFIIFLPLLYPLLVLFLGKTLHTFFGILAVVLSLIAGSVLLNTYFLHQNTDPKIGLFVFLVATLGALYGLVRWSQPKSVPATSIEEVNN